MAGAKKVGKGMSEGFGNLGYPTKRTPNLAWDPSSQESAGMLNTGIRGGVDTIYGNPPSGSQSQKVISLASTPVNNAGVSDNAISKKLPSYANEFKSNDFFVKQMDKTNGVYTMSGKGYSYYDAKNDITHTFPSKREALDSGYKEDQIQRVTISKRNVVDSSQFARVNPHNAEATRQALQQGYTSKYAHITPRSDAIRVKHNLEMNRIAFEKQGVNGILVKHFDNPNGARSSKRATTRIISIGKEKE